MIGPFDFEHDGRAYSCAVEQVRDQPWWWFRVKGDSNRYAAFNALSSDTRESVRKRVVAYYTNRVARLAAPPEPRGHWARKQQQPAAPASK